MGATSDSTALKMYKNCFSCGNLGKDNICGVENWTVDDGFAGIYADNCPHYKESKVALPHRIEFC